MTIKLMKKVLIFTFGILCTLVSLSAQEFTLNNNNFYHNTHTADIMDTHDPFLSMVAYPIGMTTNQFETEFNRRSYVSDLDWNVYCNFSTLSTLLREKEYPKYFIDMWAPVENTTEISKAWRRNLSNELDKLLDGNIIRWVKQNPGEINTAYLNQLYFSAKKPFRYN